MSDNDDKQYPVSTEWKHYQENNSPDKGRRCPVCKEYMWPAEHFENEWCCMKCGKSFDENDNYISDGDFD